MTDIGQMDCLCVKYLTVEEFRAALPHLQALGCRWLARPFGLWFQALGTHKTCEPEEVNEQISCHHYALLEPDPNHPTWWKAMQHEKFCQIRPYLGGKTVQVVLFLVDCFTADHAMLVA